MKPIRQGDVLLIPVKRSTGEKLPHLTLAEGEVTGHSHRIDRGQAELYESGGVLYLSVLSHTAHLTHEEHHPLDIPQGQWMIRIQREYEPQKRKAPWPSAPLEDDLSQHLSRQPRHVATKAEDEVDDLFLQDAIAQVHASSERELMAQALGFVNQGIRKLTSSGAKTQLRPDPKPYQATRVTPLSKARPNPTQPNRRSVRSTFESERLDPASTPSPTREAAQNWRYVVD